MTRKIEQMLNNMPGGIYNFQIAAIYRNACLISSILNGSETWYSLTLQNIQTLESVDVPFLRHLFEC